MRIGLYTRFILWINEWSAEKLLDLYDWDSDYDDNCDDCEFCDDCEDCD